MMMMMMKRVNILHIFSKYTQTKSKDSKYYYKYTHI